MRRAAAAGMAAVLACGMAWTQGAPGSVRFEYERPGMAIPHWWIEVKASGEGSYGQDAAATVAAVQQPIRVSAATLQRLEAGVAQVSAKLSAKSCETKLKHIADTGKKTIAYMDGAGQVVGSCTYNLPDDAGLRDATDAFLALQQTLEAGQRLAFKHRFDRLGLDAEINALAELVKDGRAIEVGNIAPVLQSLEDDPDVMQRVRVKAAELLKQANI